MNGMKKAMRIPPLTEEKQEAVAQLSRKTKLPRVRTRAQRVFLSAEQGLKAEEIAGVVRERAVTVLTWLKRYLTDGIEGFQEAPSAGRSATVTAEFRKCLLESVRSRPRRLGLAFGR